MALTLNTDYTFSPLVRNVLDDGVLIGTRKHIIYIPSKLREYTTRTITETDRSMDGKSMAEAVQSILQDENLTVDQLHSLMKDWGSQDGAVLLTIDELKKFKVKGGLLGGSAMYKLQHDAGWNLLCNSLGPGKKDVVAFYADMQKL